ncbi:MAG: hypothetical protein LBQ64_00700 [Bacteroidales bacterium]|jgi:hypothetical protein|nr:hypothetical protein [Bacteroidales bacterium]
MKKSIYIFYLCKKYNLFVMKKIICCLVFFLMCSNCLSAQETDSKQEFGVYLKGSLVHSYKFKLNNTLSNMGSKKLPEVLAGGVLGIFYGIKNVELTLDFGAEGFYSKTNTRLFNFLANVSAGYKLTLPKKNSLIFAGNIAYEGYNVFAHTVDGNLDFENAALINATMFHLELQQLMAGPKITWRNRMCDVSVGYDIGCIPLRWTSGRINLSNSPKERIDRVHLSLAVHLAKYDL